MLTMATLQSLQLLLGDRAALGLSPPHHAQHDLRGRKKRKYMKRGATLRAPPMIKVANGMRAQANATGQKM